MQSIVTKQQQNYSHYVSRNKKHKYQHNIKHFENVGNILLRFVRSTKHFYLNITKKKTERNLLDKGTR